MQNPAISVVMVVRNADRFLAEAIESILHQTFREFEFVIVDCGSTDNSRSIISSYAAQDSQIKFHTIPNCALAEARNAGCRLAQGRYIAMMDGDDVSAAQRLEWEFAFMEEHPEVGMVGGATDWIDATGRSLRIDRLPTQDHEIRAALENRCPFCQSTVLMRREAFVQAGGYRAVFAQAEDYDLWLRIAEHFQCANLPQVILKYRIHPHQISIRRRTQQTLCVLAAQASASSRKKGIADPLASAKEITPALLAGLGVSEAGQQIAAATEYLCWIYTMYAAGEYAVALKAAVDVLQSPDWQHMQRWQLADLQLIAARLYWKQGKWASSLRMASHAVVTRPLLLGRPVKLLLSRLQSRTLPEQIGAVH